jgi:hypothetical protein
MKFTWPLVALTLLTAAPAAAQTTALTDARWAGWIGCWVPREAANAPRDIRECVVPTADGRGVRMITFANDRQVFEEAIVADNNPQPYAEDSCTGERRGQWSADGERVFTTSQLTCEGSAPVTTRGISTLLNDREWLDLQVADRAGEPRVRVRRYTRSPDAWPPSIREHAETSQAAPPVALSATTAADVAEAHDAAGPLAVQAWLVESKAQVPIDRRTLIGLADRGVAEPVIDLLVARAFPGKFEVRASSYGGGGDGWWSPEPIVLGGLGHDVNPDALYFAPFGPYYYGRYDYYWQYSGYQQIVVTNPASVVPTGGQVVNGRGYTQVRERAPDPATARGGGGDAAYGGGGSSGGGSISSSGYSGGGSTGVTAVAR